MCVFQFECSLNKVGNLKQTRVITMFKNDYGIITVKHTVFVVNIFLIYIYRNIETVTHCVMLIEFDKTIDYL